MELQTAVEVALCKLESREPIPRMTHPLSTAWGQPDRSEIEVDGTHALMSRTAFCALKEYSASQPTGVYEGKMWRRHDGSFDREFIVRGGKPTWMLCWYGPSEKGPEFCKTNMRIILLSDGELPE
jgi:hypothetical protein